jgi:hypothetical protein
MLEVITILWEFLQVVIALILFGFFIGIGIKIADEFSEWLDKIGDE